MITTIHTSCITLLDVLKNHGIEDVILSPGSRNAPLITAFARDNHFRKKVVIDERAAAFMALGMAQCSQRPVVIVCTSGTAMLNYAPAIAEAFYQSIPLIVVTADRSEEWIDQDDSQTINQCGALAAIVKKSYDVSPNASDWYINRTINDAIITAQRGRKAPVHINMQFASDLYEMGLAVTAPQRIVTNVEPEPVPSEAFIEECAQQIAKSEKVLIVAGFGTCNAELSLAIDKLAQMPNVAVLTETVSNIASQNTIKAIDRTLLAVDNDDVTPHLLITFGGALVSRFVKNYLRSHKAKVHWHISLRENVIDTMQSLTHRIVASPETFFKQLSKKLKESVASNYNAQWHEVESRGVVRHNAIVSSCGEWCDMIAMQAIFNSLRSHSWQLHLSNGTPIRYAQLFAEGVAIPCFCNRGVSGIDGSTSTAIGSSLAHEGNTLFITGDMSFMYDLGGLASQYKNSRLRIIVMCNGGGGIFRFIAGESVKDEINDYYSVNYEYRAEEIAKAFGYETMVASSLDELKQALATLYNSNSPMVLLVNTPGEKSGEILKNYFNKKIWQQEIGKQ